MFGSPTRDSGRRCQYRSSMEHQCDVSRDHVFHVWDPQGKYPVGDVSQVSNSPDDSPDQTINRIKF